MANNLMICSNGCKALHLNESDNSGQRYILEGTFAELDKLNRNQRIYTKAEYLKHLAYLRNDIKSGEPLLGELDHPDDRFEVKLKEASHRVIDLWYDESDNTVKGKIELLDTPNGKLAKSIVDQGIPLHISSRAAGTVNNDNTVSIQQIYTYDLVCKPGFAGAVLHRVNESADAPKYTPDVRNFLNASYRAESMNAAPQYGFVNEDMSVSEIKANAVLRNEAKDIQINKQIEINVEEMSKPLLENTNPDATIGKPLDISGNGAAALGIPTADDLQQKESDDDGEKKKDEKKEKQDVSDNAPEANDKPAESDKKDNKLNSDSEKKEETSEDDGGDSSECDAGKPDKEAEKLNDDKDTPDVKDDDNKSDDDKEEDKDDSDDEGSEDSDDSSKDSGVKIIDVEAEFEDEDKDDMIKDVEPSFDDDEEKGDEDKEEGESAEKEEGEPESDTEDTKDEAAERTVDAEDDEKSKKDAEEEEKKAKEAEKLADKASDDIEKRKDTIMDKLDKLKDAIEKKNSSKEESKNESIIMAQYPISMRMNESNFKEFAKLDESQKNKVVAYLHDNGIADVQSINESWKNGINYVNEIPVWLKYAPENYKSLYEAASDQVKESINTTAKYILFENQYDINVFWENSGLQEAEERRLVNESFVNNLPKVTPQPAETNLPYSAEFIKMITEQACEYGKKY